VLGLDQRNRTYDDRDVKKSLVGLNGRGCCCRRAAAFAKAGEDLRCHASCVCYLIPVFQYRLRHPSSHSRSRSTASDSTAEVTVLAGRVMTKERKIHDPALTLVTLDRQLDHAVSLVLSKLSRKN
jgi:hypothetical protein